MVEGPLQGKVAIVTGAASPIGLGHAMTAALVRAGARVALLDVNDAWLAHSVAEMQTIGGEGCALSLRTDITDPAIIDAWVQNIEEGRSVTVLAECDDSVAGYASIHTDGARWTRRVGEIRVQVGIDYRGLGLGKRLVGEIFRLSQDLGLKKMAAMMTPEQASARATFEELGFRVEAQLQDWVVDREGRSRDLMILSLLCER